MLLVSASTGTVVVREEPAPSPSTFDASTTATVTTAAAVPAMRQGVQRVRFDVAPPADVTGGGVREARDDGRDVPEVRFFFCPRGFRGGAVAGEEPGDPGPDVGAVP